MQFMKLSRDECCVLNSGSGSWAFEPLAHQLSAALGIDISEKPRQFNYLLHVEHLELAFSHKSFIPIEAIRFASDKRFLADIFNKNNVAVPQTTLFERFADIQTFLKSNGTRQWCLKYPTSCGANGHRMLSAGDNEPANWPKPYVVQEFVPLVKPEVYRTYCADGKLFGWLVRRFPSGSKQSPWVAHARGARYVLLDDAPANALEAARQALTATSLWDTFGCVDLICRSNGEWLVLEVGTDGVFNHVDREIGNSKFEDLLFKNIASAFWHKVNLQ